MTTIAELRKIATDCGYDSAQLASMIDKHGFAGAADAMRAGRFPTEPTPAPQAVVYATPAPEPIPTPSDALTLTLGPASIRTTEPELLAALEALGWSQRPKVSHKAPNGSHASKQWQTLRTAVAARVHVWLWGEAGTGKSTAARLIAKEAGLPVYAMSVGPLTDQYSFAGVIYAAGNYVPTPFRLAFEFGGVFLMDESDTLGDGGIWINDAIASRWASFPDRPEGLAAHDDFIVIAAANTDGTGGTGNLRHRQVVDGPLMDRFLPMVWELEESVIDAQGASKAIRAAWESARRANREHGLGKTLTIRSLIRAVKLAGAGMSESDAIDTAIFAGWSIQDRSFAR